MTEEHNIIDMSPVVDDPISDELYRLGFRWNPPDKYAFQYSGPTRMKHWKHKDYPIEAVVVPRDVRTWYRFGVFRHNEEIPEHVEFTSTGKSSCRSFSYTLGELRECERIEYVDPYPEIIGDKEDGETVIVNGCFPDTPITVFHET